MAIEVRRRPKETISSLVRRFSRAVQQSGILLRARKIRFREKERSKEERREAALRRQKILAEREKLKKMGLLEDNY